MAIQIQMIEIEFDHIFANMPSYNALHNLLAVHAHSVSYHLADLGQLSEALSLISQMPLICPKTSRAKPQPLSACYILESGIR